MMMRENIRHNTICDFGNGELLSCQIGKHYEIKKGETLVDICKHFDIGLEKLLLSNPYLNPNYFLAGQIIVIPEQKEYTLTAADEYEIGARESISDVVRRLDVSVADIKKENPGIDVFNLKRGNRIKIPKKRSDRKDSRYQMKSGETLSSISKALGVDALLLLRANPHLRPNEFMPGQKIRLPKEHML